MTKREVAIIAFAVATMLLALVIVVGRVSLPVQQGTRLPRLNGTPLDIPIVTHTEIEAGRLLEFDMGPTPSKWGSSWRGVPLPAFAP